MGESCQKAAATDKQVSRLADSLPGPSMARLKTASALTMRS
jgi:hypothetical protein